MTYHGEQRRKRIAQRIAELEAEVERLRADNAYLRSALSAEDLADAKGRLEAAKEKRGPTCREFAYGIGRDQSRAMGIPLTDEPLGEWEAKMKAAKAAEGSNG